jgi:uncharacterized protein YukE
VTVPASYDNVTLSVEPGPLMMAADMIKDAADSTIAALNTIGNTLDDLQLGWDGTTAAEAKDFSDQWLAAMNGMFGTTKNPQNGVMNQVIAALMSEAGNASSAENSIVQMFASLQAMLAGSALSTPAPDTAPMPAGTSGTFDMSLTAITEINWQDGTPLNPG